MRTNELETYKPNTAKKNEVRPGKNFRFILKHFKRYMSSDKKNPVTIKLRGASRSGKTYDVCIFICLYVQKYTGKKIVIARNELTTLKSSVYATLEDTWRSLNMPSDVFNKTASNINYNGNRITFKGLLEKQKVLGVESDLLFINEAIECDQSTVNQLKMRNKGGVTILDYNPSRIDSWIYKDPPNTFTLTTSIFDNPFAPAAGKAEILQKAHPDIDDYDKVKRHGYSESEWISLKDRNLMAGTADLKDWCVYGLGMSHGGDDLVFPTFQSFDKFPDESELFSNAKWRLLGLDWGYTKDPTAIVEIRKYADNSIYIKEHLYKTQMFNSDISNFIIQNGLQDLILVCDSADAKSIGELQWVHDLQAKGAKKGPGSIYLGLQRMLEHKLFLNGENLIREFNGYNWKKDRSGNYALSAGKQVPVDKDNHLIDAARYAIYYYTA